MSRIYNPEDHHYVIGDPCIKEKIQNFKGYYYLASCVPRIFGLEDETFGKKALSHSSLELE